MAIFFLLLGLVLFFFYWLNLEANRSMGLRK